MRSSWRLVCPLQVTCHAESGCLHVGRAVLDNDDKGGGAVFLQPERLHVASTLGEVHKVTCLRAVSSILLSAPVSRLTNIMYVFVSVDYLICSKRVCLRRFSR